MAQPDSGEAALAAFAADLTFDDIPDALVQTAERCFLDTVGVGIPGARQGAGRIAAGVVAATGGDGPSTLFADGTTASVADAAFANGTACHGLDFDDVTDAMNGHASTTMIPALIAVGEAEEATGEELLTAYVAGFEAQAYIAQPILPRHYELGWHSTATHGTLGTAVAVATLLDLDADGVRTALNVAASGAAGLKKNFGSMTKPLHAGQAARTGTSAALLARDGFTADPDAIEGALGYYDRYVDEDPDLSRRQALGEEWALDTFGVDVKKYPCCYYTHTSIETASRLVEVHDIAPEDVESIDVYTSGAADSALLHEDPQTGLEGKFSMEHVVASAVARDRVDLRTFEDENVADTAVQQVRARVTAHTDDALPFDTYHSTVVIETVDGAQFEGELERPPGGRTSPLSAEELAEKFHMCVDYAGLDGGDARHDVLADLRHADAVDVAGALSP